MTTLLVSVSVDDEVLAAVGLSRVDAVPWARAVVASAVARRFLEQTGRPWEGAGPDITAAAIVDGRRYRASTVPGTLEDRGRVGVVDAETVARAFHAAYERLAPSMGYETREDSRTAWEDVPETNRRLMVATAAAVVDELALEAIR